MVKQKIISMILIILPLFSLASTVTTAFASESSPSFKKQVDEAQQAHLQTYAGGCNVTTEQTCYDDDWNPIGCVKWEDGGCPCREGETRCGEGWASYCTTSKVCCNWQTQETCYSSSDGTAESCAEISEGGCECTVPGEVKCGGDGVYWAGYCTPLCCQPDEETCYDDDWDPISCATFESGGCPCPSGQVRCEVSEGYSGYCTPVCCQPEEETCTNPEGEVESCAPINEGGCKCPEGQVKCGSGSNWAYCTELCCEEETCFDDDYTPISCTTYEKGCPSDSLSGSNLLDHLLGHNTTYSNNNYAGERKNSFRFEASKVMRETKIMLADKLAKKRAYDTQNLIEEVALL